MFQPDPLSITPRYASSYTSSPKSRVALGVKDGEHQDGVWLDAIDDREREPMNSGATELPVNDREGARGILDQRKCPLDLLDEQGAETGPLGLIPRCSFLELDLRSRAKYRAESHRARRASAETLTSAQDIAASGEAS